VLSILGEQPFQRVTSNNLTEVVGSLRRRIGERYGNRDLLSAATKLLWLFHRESVVIFDSQARVALGATHRDYDAYLGRWRDEFARTEPAIRKACRALPGRRSAMSLTDEVSADHVREVSRQEWFRMRVLDIHLWNRGARLLRRR
jgi:hypothetical protein